MSGICTRPRHEGHGHEGGRGQRHTYGKLMAAVQHVPHFKVAAVVSEVHHGGTCWAPAACQGRAGQAAQGQARSARQSTTPTIPSLRSNMFLAWYPPCLKPCCMLPPVHTQGREALPLAPALAKLKQMSARRGRAATTRSVRGLPGCSLSAAFTSQPSPAASESVIPPYLSPRHRLPLTPYLTPYFPPPATHPWCSSPRHSPTGTAVWLRPRARSGSSSPRRTAGCRRRRGSAPGRQWGQRVPREGWG